MDEEEFLEDEDVEEVDEPTSSVQLEKGKKYSKLELEEVADQILRDDSNKELCRQCKEKHKEKDPDRLPYGYETGHVEWQIARDKKGEPKLDDEGNVAYVAFPELQCEKGHRWYLGEGVRRNLNGPNPILFESHLYHRKRREILTNEGTPDPAYTMDRWGKRPAQTLYIRTHPSGRKVNSPEQRASSGASFYR